MPEIDFVPLLIVLLVAFLAPIVVEVLPGPRIPAEVLEIVLGIVLGPAVLAWVPLDGTIELLAVIGLAFLLFLAGLEIDLRELRGRTLRLAGAGFGMSLVLAAVAGGVLAGVGLVDSAPFIAVALLATSLGLVVPVVANAGHAHTPVGQLVIAGSSIADLASVVLLSLVFSAAVTSFGARFFLLGVFLVAVVAVGLAVTATERLRPIMRIQAKLEDTSAQLRVRAAVLVLVALVAVASRIGLEAILGAFVAGIVLATADRDELARHPSLRSKLEGIGFGFLVPIYFVASGLRFDLQALFASRATLASIPVFLAALLMVRGGGAMLYRPVVGSRQTVAAALLQATSLPFLVAAAQIGQEMGLVTPATGAALVGAGLFSVVIFPSAALSLLRSPASKPEPSAVPTGV